MMSVLQLDAVSSVEIAFLSSLYFVIRWSDFVPERQPSFLLAPFQTVIYFNFFKSKYFEFDQIYIIKF